MHVMYRLSVTFSRVLCSNVFPASVLYIDTLFLAFLSSAFSPRVVYSPNRLNMAISWVSDFLYSRQFDINLVFASFVHGWMIMLLLVDFWWYIILFHASLLLLSAIGHSTEEIVVYIYTSYVNRFLNAHNVNHHSICEGEINIWNLKKTRIAIRICIYIVSKNSTPSIPIGSVAHLARKGIDW